MKYFDKGANTIFIHICKNIDFNSNVIKFTEKDIIDEYSISVETFYNGFNVLYNFDVIKATTRKSVYVINHNIIFKGSIGDFIKEYNKYYENINVIINDKEDKCVKGCYVANPKYIYSGTPEDYVNDCFELQTKGILVLI